MKPYPFVQCKALDEWQELLSQLLTGHTVGEQTRTVPERGFLTMASLAWMGKDQFLTGLGKFELLGDQVNERLEVDYRERAAAAFSKKLNLEIFREWLAEPHEHSFQQNTGIYSHLILCHEAAAEPIVLMSPEWYWKHRPPVRGDIPKRSCEL